MEHYGGRKRATPSNMTVPCANLGCNERIPYDPSNSIGMCNDCLQHPALKNRGAANLMFTDNEQSVAGLTAFPMTPSAGHKRQADSPAQGGSFKKRALTSGYSDATVIPFVHDESGQEGLLSYGHIPTMGSTEEDDGGDEFVDAQEEQNPSVVEDLDAAFDEIKEESDDGQAKDNNEIEMIDSVAASNAGEEGAAGSVEEGDLFDSAFAETAAEEGDEDDAGDEEDESSEFKRTKTNQKLAAATTTKDVFITSEHAKGCKPGSGPSTPRNTSSRSSSVIPAASKGPDPVSDLSWSLKKQKAFHDRAVELIPRLPLAGHRYWIGVLNLGVKPKNFSQEKHFTWMKGNRFTTVKTVWHSYQTATATDDFVLLLGNEKVEDTDRMEELDHFNEKKIMFRAVDPQTAERESRELCHSGVPKEPAEVIVID